MVVRLFICLELTYVADGKLSQKSDFILQLFRLSNFSGKPSESTFNNSRLFQVQKIISLGARALLWIKRRLLEKIPRLNSILTISGKSILYSLCRNKNFQLKRRRDFSIASDVNGQKMLSRPREDAIQAGRNLYIASDIDLLARTQDLIKGKAQSSPIN